LAEIQVNVSDWNDMSTHRLSQLARIKNPANVCWSSTKSMSLSYHQM